jgi:hypothetical protein
MNLDEEDEILYSSDFINTRTIADNDLKRLSGTLTRFDQGASVYNTNTKYNDYRSSISSKDKEFEKYIEAQEEVQEEVQQIRSSIKSDNKDDSPIYYIEQVETVTIDSRDRNTILFPSPNHFVISLGKSFVNINKIELLSIEFPNTNAVINSNNNLIYWINQEDIIRDIVDPVTKTYPVYSATLRVGSYIASILQTEIQSKLNSVKRRNKSGDFHYFINTLDIQTDETTFVSLILNQMNPNSINTISGSSTITVTYPNNGVSIGSNVYFTGANNVNGIQSTSINTVHVVTAVIDPNTFTIEVDTKASLSGSSGGTNMKLGTLAPFQLLFGDYTGTVAPNIGFYNRNSSQVIKTYIKNMVPYLQLMVITQEIHGLTNTDILSTCVISGTGVSIDGVVQITRVFDTHTFYISTGSVLDESVYTGTVVIKGVLYNIIEVSNPSISTVLLTTWTPHNYNHSDTVINLIGTTTRPSFDGNNTISSILDDTSIVIYGEIPTGVSANSTIYSDIGYSATSKPFDTYYYKLTDVTIGATTKLTIPGHGLSVGDEFMIYNLKTSPFLTNNVQRVFAVINADTIVLNITTSYLDTDSLDNAGIGTDKIKFYFPYHGFNTISLINRINATTVQITTKLAHNLTNQQLLRIMQTDSVPAVNGVYTITVTGTDTFTIPFNNLTQTGFNGIIGMSLGFTIYGATSFGGFEDTILNNNRYSVYNIIDTHNFIFQVRNYYATSSSKGGGNSVFISSFFHGFSGVQNNVQNGVINKSITLAGENYSLLVCPQLPTIHNIGPVENIFARISLDQSPGAMCFNFLSNPKIYFQNTLAILPELEFYMKNYDDSLYEFNNLDYSFVLGITRLVEKYKHLNLNSRRTVPIEK